MRIHTTNYFNTFILIADDCPSTIGEVPPTKADATTVVSMQFELIQKKPYHYTSDDIVFAWYALKNDLTKSEQKAARELFFSKGQPCLRASQLTKRYGWGMHYNAEGKIAIYGSETKEYKQFSNDKNLKILKAMKSNR